MRRFCLCGLLLAACYRVPPTPTPMAFVADPLPGEKPARCLLVLFPGARDRADTFREEHFIEDIRASGVSVDVVSADATMGYYLKSIAARRLEDDVIGPARARHPYEQVWLLGISMGGYGTFHYAQEFPDHVDGIAAFAPFLGDEAVVQAVRDAGGLKQWSPPPVAPTNDQNYGQQLWGTLHRFAVGEGKVPELYLGCGDSDRMKPAVDVLAAALPKDRVLTTAGGHTWGPWRDLLRQFLATEVFQARCGSTRN